MMYWVVIILKIVYIFNSILLKNKKNLGDGERKGDGDVKVGLTFFVLFVFFAFLHGIK